MKSFRQFVNESKIPSPTVDALKLIKKNKNHPEHIRKVAHLHISAINDKEPDSLKHAKAFINQVNNLKEDGMGGGAVAAGPTNVVGSGAIAGSGGKGGEPGVDLRKKKRNPVMGYVKRKSPQF